MSKSDRVIGRYLTRGSSPGYHQTIISSFGNDCAKLLLLNEI